MDNKIKLSNYLQSYIIEFLIEYILINKKSNKINKKSILKVGKDEIIKYVMVSKHWLNSIQSTILLLKPIIDFENDDIEIKKWWLEIIRKQKQQSIFSKLNIIDVLINNDKDNQIIKYKYEIIDQYDHDQLLRIWSKEYKNNDEEDDEISKIIYNICLFLIEDEELPIIDFSTLMISNSNEKRNINTNKLFIQNIEKIESRILFELIKDCNASKLHIAPSFSNIEGPIHLDYHSNLFRHQYQFKHIKLDEDYLDPFQLSNIYKQTKLHTLSFKLACHEIIKECFYFFKNKKFGKFTNIDFELYDDGTNLIQKQIEKQKQNIQPLKARTDLLCKCKIDSLYPSFNLYDIVSDLKAMVLGICNSKSLKNLTLKNRCFGLCFWEQDIISFLNDPLPPATTTPSPPIEFYTITHCLKSLISNTNSIENLKFENFDFLNEFILSGLLENQSIKSIYFKNSLPTIESLEYLLNQVIARPESNINHLKISYDLISDLNKGFKYHNQFNKLIIKFIKSKSSSSSNLYSIEFPIDTNLLDDLLISLSNNNNNNYYYKSLTQINLIYFETSKKFPNSKNKSLIYSKINEFNNNNLIIKLIIKNHLFNSQQ